MEIVNARVLLPLATILLTPLLAHADNGFTFDVTMTGAKNGKQEPPLVFKTRISGPRARIDISADKDEWKKGDYLLTTDSGATYLLVSPSRKTVKKLDQASVKANVEKENKGMSVDAPQTAWKEVAPNQQQMTRSYAIRFRQGLVSGKGAITEAHDYTLAAPDAVGPAFNPMINYTLQDVASLLLKNKTFEAAGLASVLPRGFVTRATIRLNAVIQATFIGNKKEESTVTLTTSAPLPTDLSADVFILPSGYSETH